MWVSKWFPNAVLYSEDIGTTALATILSETRPVSQISIEREVLLIELLLNGKIVTFTIIVAYEWDLFELTFQSGTGDGLTYKDHIGGGVVLELDDTYL